MPGFRATVRVGVLAAAALLMVLPAIPLAAGASPAPTSGARPTSAPGFSANVYWNGADVSSAGSPSSAITISSYASVTVLYFWNSTATGAGEPLHLYNVTDARLAMTYFGYALSTRDVPPVLGGTETRGSFDMSWNVGAIQYVLGGTYLVTATLFAANGTNLWSENFYVHLVPPYSLLAIVPILLIIIAIFEVIAIARSGRQAALKAPPSAKPPPPSSPAPSPPPPAAPPPTPPTGETPPTSPGSTPPGGP